MFTSCMAVVIGIVVSTAVMVFTYYSPCSPSFPGHSPSRFWGLGICHADRERIHLSRGYTQVRKESRL